MKSSVAQEAALIERILTFKDSPLDFIRFVIPWGEPGTAFEQWKEPRAWQVEELGLLQDHVQKVVRARQAGLGLPELYRAAYSSGRGPGKSALLGMVALWHASTHFGAPTIVAANSENQLRSRTFPEFARWAGGSILGHWWVIEGMQIYPQSWLATAVEKPAAQGGLGIDAKYWYIKGATWTEENPSAFAGAHNQYGMVVLFDEADGIPLPIWTNTEGFFTDDTPYRVWLAASQLRANKGPMYDLFYDPVYGKGWRTRMMNVEGMEGVDQNWVKQMIERYGFDSDQVRVEVRGMPPLTSEDQFIPHDAVQLAQDNILLPDYGEPLIMGVDPAPRGKTAIRFRQGRNARDPIGKDSAILLEGYDNVQIAERIVQLDEKYKPDAIAIDFGMGTGVIDILSRKGWIKRKLHPVKFGDMPPKSDKEFGSMGAYLWGKVRDWLPGGMIPRDDGEKGTLTHQLKNRGWKWSGREDNRKVMESKEDLKARGIHSPDDADALALTLAVNPPRTDGLGRKGNLVSRRAIGVEDNAYGF